MVREISLYREMPSFHSRSLHPNETVYFEQRLWDTDLKSQLLVSFHISHVNLFISCSFNVFITWIVFAADCTI